MEDNTKSVSTGAKTVYLTNTKGDFVKNSVKLSHDASVDSSSVSNHIEDLATDLKEKLTVKGKSKKQLNGIVNGTGTHTSGATPKSQQIKSKSSNKQKSNTSDKTAASDAKNELTLPNKSKSRCAQESNSTTPVSQSTNSQQTSNLTVDAPSISLDSNENQISDCKAIESSDSQDKDKHSQTKDGDCTVVEEIPTNVIEQIQFVQYESELQMPLIIDIIQKKLSEPYSIYTYRYFIHNWPQLCFLAMYEDKCVGAIVCKLDVHRKTTYRGYIAMLAVDENFRKRSIGSTLVKRAIREMWTGGADEVVLETEVTNKPALRLYEALGFVRDKRLFRYYLNGVDALRLKLWLR